MAIYRSVQTSFWTDTKVVDDFTPEDRYFYLYLFTNPHTNLAGCYEISIRQMAMETGYGKETVERLIERMSVFHNVIMYDSNTKEMLILNWCKYNWTKSEKFRKPLLNEIRNIKNPSFNNYLMDMYNDVDTVSIRYPYRMDTTVTDTVSNTVSNSITDNKNHNDIYLNVISYLNTKTGKRFNYSTKAIQESINARIREGYTEDDFYKVIDNKCHEWLGTEQEKFLRPSTLFAPSHFDEYLNQGMVKKKLDAKSNSQSVNEYMLSVIRGESI